MADGYLPLTIEHLKTVEGVNQLNRMLSFLFENIASDGDKRKVHIGVGTPEGAVTAGIGSLYLRTDGGASTSLYVKESTTVNTGWVAK